MKTLNLEKLVDFFDHKVQSSLRLGTPVNSVIGEELAVALMRHYFESKEKCKFEISQPCNQGAQKGYRLDCWLHLRRNGEESRLYQTEIKNWSAHSLGGTVIPPSVTEAGLKKIIERNWKSRFSHDTNIPRKASASKVLVRMNPPPKWADLTVMPLLCLWECLHPDGNFEPFFHRPIHDRDFQSIYVFSLSAYVRMLLAEGTKNIPSLMPQTDRAMYWLNDMYR
jgi:hypothetical protein